MLLTDTIHGEFNKSGVGSHSGNIFQGVISSSDTGTFCVQVSPLGQRQQSLIQGIPLSTCMAHLMGFKESVLPQVGSYVLCYRSAVNQCIILGVIPKPDSLGVEGQMPNRTIIGAGDGNNDEQNTVGYGSDGTKFHTINNTRPTDITEGDYVIGNDFGVLLGLFSQFATLKASELAQVQAFVLDDLVRIISHNFQHFTALGEMKVFHDGQGIHLECGMTHSPHESLGMPEVVQLAKDSPIEFTGTATIDDKDNFYNLKDEQQTAVERLKIIVGKLGDFVKIMLVRPSETDTNNIGGFPKQNPDTGLFDFQLLGDGTTLVRSVKGISLQKTNWIRVPNRIRSPENPLGDDGATIVYPEKKAYEFDKTFTYEGQPFLYFLQIRDYLAYMNEEYSIANIKVHTEDYFINDDVTKEKILTDIEKIDPLSNTHYEKKTSSISLMPNGGIALTDAWGSSIVLEGGDIYIQAAKDEYHQPMRNLVAKVGKSISMSSKNEIDFSSTEGGLRIKTQDAQYFYSDKAGIILEANGPLTQDFSPTDSALSSVSGIVLKSANSGIYSYSQYNYQRTTIASTLYAKECFFTTDTSLLLTSQGSLDVQCASTINMGANNIFMIASSESVLAGLTNTVVGLKLQTIAVSPSGPVSGYLTTDGLDKVTTNNTKVQGFKAADFTPNFKQDNAFTSLQFKFLASSKYGLTNNDIMPQTMTQIEDNKFNTHSLVTWTEQSINNTYPFPGASNPNFLATVVLENLELIDGEIKNKAIGLTGLQSITKKNIFSEYTVTS